MANVAVFISYSRTDAAFAERLKADLRAAGVNIWIDHESIQPGAPDWQDAIRRGIDAATAVVYIASPDAAQSLNVRAEVVIANEERRQTMPIWARGEKWSQCAPFELIGANYLDARGDRYSDALARLCAALNVSTPAAQPQAEPVMSRSAPDSAGPGLRALRRLRIDAGSVVRSVAWSPDGARLASGGTERAIHLWEPASGRLLASLAGHTDVVYSVAWSPDGSRLASGAGYFNGPDNDVRLWDAASGRMLASLTGHTRGVNSVAWSPDGSQLASASDDSTVRLWEPASGRGLTTIEGASGYYIMSVAWSPDGARLASGGTEQAVHLWESTSGSLLASLAGHTDVVYSVAWSPDGSRLASGGGNIVNSDNDVRLWDPLTRKLFATLSGHTSGINCVAWAPDGSRLASASNDETIRLWDPKSGRLLATLTGHTSSVLCVAWAPDGSRLASGSRDGTIRIWEIVEE